MESPSSMKFAIATPDPEDDPASDVFVYDGPWLKSECLGTLKDFIDENRTTSSHDGVSLVYFNGRRKYAGSFVIANTESSLSHLNNYQLLISGDNHAQQFSDFSDKASAITVICPEEGCSSSYIQELEFLEGTGQVEISTGAPYRIENKGLRWPQLNPIMVYRKDNYSSLQSMPQEIPVNMFTITYKQLKISLRVAAADGYSNWLIPHHGRRITVFSPSVFDGRTPSGFSHKFASLDNQEFKYSINLKSMVVAVPGEHFRATVGDGTGVTTDALVKCEDDLLVCTEDYDKTIITGQGSVATVKFTAFKYPAAAIVEIDVEKVEEDDGKNGRSGVMGFVNSLVNEIL